MVPAFDSNTDSPKINNLPSEIADLVRLFILNVKNTNTDAAITLYSRIRVNTPKDTKPIDFFPPEITRAFFKLTVSRHLNSDTDTADNPSYIPFDIVSFFNDLIDSTYDLKLNDFKQLRKALNGKFPLQCGITILERYQQARNRHPQLNILAWYLGNVCDDSPNISETENQPATKSAAHRCLMYILKEYKILSKDVSFLLHSLLFAELKNDNYVTAIKFFHSICEKYPLKMSTLVRQLDEATRRKRDVEAASLVYFILKIVELDKEENFPRLEEKILPSVLSSLIRFEVRLKNDEIVPNLQISVLSVVFEYPQFAKVWDCVRAYPEWNLSNLSYDDIKEYITKFKSKHSQLPSPPLLEYFLEFLPIPATITETIPIDSKMYKTKRLEIYYEFLNFLRENGLSKPTYPMYRTILIETAKAEHYIDAFNLFNRLLEMDVVPDLEQWRWIVHHLARNGFVRQMHTVILKLFELIKNQKLVTNRNRIPTSKNIGEFGVEGNAMRNSGDVNVLRPLTEEEIRRIHFCVETGIFAWAKMRKLDMAQEYISIMDDVQFSPGIGEFSALMEGYARNGDVDLALKYYESILITFDLSIIKRSSLFWSAMNSCIQCLTTLERFHNVRQLLVWILETVDLGLKGTASVETNVTFDSDMKNLLSTMISVFIEVGETAMALNVWDKCCALFVNDSKDLEKMNVALLQGYIKVKQLNTAMEKYEEMVKLGRQPVSPTLYLSLIQSSARLNNADAAIEVYNRMRARGYDADAATYAIMIHLYARVRNNLDFASQLLEILKRMPDAYLPQSKRWFFSGDRIYQAMDETSGNRYRNSETLHLHLAELPPTSIQIAYTSLIAGYCRHRLLSKALKLLENMDVYKVSPTIHTLTPIILRYVKSWNRLAALSLLAEYINPVRNQQVFPDAKALRALYLGYVPFRRVELKVQPRRTRHNVAEFLQQPNPHFSKNSSIPTTTLPFTRSKLKIQQRRLQFRKFYGDVCGLLAIAFRSEVEKSGVKMDGETVKVSDVNVNKDKRKDQMYVDIISKKVKQAAYAGAMRESCRRGDLKMAEYLYIEMRNEGVDQAEVNGEVVTLELDSSTRKELVSLYRKKGEIEKADAIESEAKGSGDVSIDFVSGWRRDEDSKRFGDANFFEE
ncbi:hypothetical protein HK098_006558 [Nowakowskiella sp. JEL0407]|nr:hypothetical protein HK098_006558 [Nowakowskiella sp. JEL0407]